MLQPNFHVSRSAIEIFLDLDRDVKLIFFMNYTWIIIFRIFILCFSKSVFLFIDLRKLEE